MITIKKNNLKVWKALYVSSRSEKKVQEKLIEKGIEAYTPIKKTLRQWSDRKKMVQVPVLNGYVFVKVTEQERDKVLFVNGVVQYVRFNEKDAIIKEEEITNLKNIISLGYEIQGGGHKDLPVGTKIIITHGSLKGIEGTVQQIQNDEWLFIHLESIQYNLRVKLPGSILKAYEEEI